MRVLLFGATGMIGQGVLRECLLDPEIEHVLAVGRSATGQRHAKLRELTHRDFSTFGAVESDLSGYDACFFCLGVSSAGMSERDYRRVTYEYTMEAAHVLAKANPGMAFVYVSGAGADSTGKGRLMWARVKGETENALLGLPLRSCVFRPAFVQPLHGITSRTKLYRAIYAVMAPLFPLWNAVAPRYVTTTERIGRAMIAVAKHGAATRVLENRDINDIAAASRA